MISVIIPIYNTAQFLPRCIESVQRQTYGDLEIILVNDGSKDNALSICQAYAKNDRRIYVIDKPNGGLSHARNCGTEKASGEYIFYLDSDDFLENNALEILIETIQKDQSDMVVFDFQRFCYQDEKIQLIETEKSAIPPGIYTNMQALALFELTPVNLVTACSKLYKSSIAKSVAFPLGKINEDEFTAHQFIEQCQRISVISAPLYCYQDNPSSIINTAGNLKNTDKLFAIYERICVLKKYGLVQAEKKQIFVFYLHYRMIYPYQAKFDSAKAKEIKRLYKALFKDILNLQNITLCDKIKILCLRWISGFYSTIYCWVFKV